MKTVMMKYTCAIISLLLCFASYGQRSKPVHLIDRIEIGITYPAFLFEAIDAFVSVDKVLYDIPYLKISSGCVAQFSHYPETAIVTGMTGYSQERSLFITSKLNLFSHKTKGIFTGGELFCGTTNLYSKGKLSIPEYDISENFSKSYLYFNYGFAILAGYSWERFSLGAFYRSSLKGYLDNGRKRPGDNDSGIYIGLNIGFKIKPKKNDKHFVSLN
jgi:hypothetical protein